MIAKCFAAATALWGLVLATPAQAGLFNFEFDFIGQFSGLPVSGNFIFDDDVEPIVTPIGSFFGGASSSFTINAGGSEFTGFNNSIVVTDNFVNPDGTITDLIIFDDFADFDPTNPAGGGFSGLFIYGPDTFDSEDLPPFLGPAEGVALVTTPDEVGFFSTEASTSITPVPEPSSWLGLLALAGLGVAGFGKQGEEI